eukprot:PhF_6_TR41743/c0_g1_i1/m.63353
MSAPQDQEYIFGDGHLSKVVIGVDGGGTKAAFVVILVPTNTSQTSIVSEIAEVGSTNWNSVGIDTAKKHLLEGILTVLSSVRCSLKYVTDVVLTMAGVDRDPDKVQLISWVREILPQSSLRVSVYHDAVSALGSGLRHGTDEPRHGVVVISGTGCIVYGRNNRTGKESRALGWGPGFLDYGSGHAIATAMLHVIAEAVDGRGPQTKLVPALLQRLELREPKELVSWLYKDVSWARVAGLSDVVFEVAYGKEKEGGDEVAQQILKRSADELAKGVAAVCRSLEFQNLEVVPLVLAGGVFGHNELFAESVTKASQQLLLSPHGGTDLLLQCSIRLEQRGSVIHPALAAAQMAL